VDADKRPEPAEAHPPPQRPSDTTKKSEPTSPTESETEAPARGSAAKGVGTEMRPSTRKPGTSESGKQANAAASGVAKNKDGKNSKSRRQSGSQPTDRADRYRAIVQHAHQAPREAERSLKGLAAYLIEPARDDREKAWSIYCWIADRIAYNAEALLAGKFPKDCSAEAVLNSRLTVCEGYANLFLALCEEAKVEVVKVHGHCKGYGYIRGDQATTNHAWNAIKLDGTWGLVDVTWGTGYLNSAKEFTKRFDNFYFLTPPEEFIFSHLPETQKWQFLDPPVSREDYQRWPRVGIALFKFGASAKKLRQTLEDKSFREFVQAFYQNEPIRVHQAPLEKQLRAGQEYNFQIEAPTCSSIVLSNNGKRVVCVKDGNMFYAKVWPLEGRMHVGGQFPSKDERFWTILQYSVESDAGVP
jgi:hypothetical protein